jgi:hypothetical protein
MDDVKLLLGLGLILGIVVALHFLDKWLKKSEYFIVNLKKQDMKLESSNKHVSDEKIASMVKYSSISFCCTASIVMFYTKDFTLVVPILMTLLITIMAMNSKPMEYFALQLSLENKEVTVNIPKTWLESIKNEEGTRRSEKKEY